MATSARLCVSEDKLHYRPTTRRSCLQAAHFESQSLSQLRLASATPAEQCLVSSGDLTLLQTVKHAAEGTPPNSVSPSRSLTHCANTRCTRWRGLRGEQPPATSERRRGPRPRPRLREPRQQRSYTAAPPRPTRAGRGSVHHRAPASRHHPTTAAQPRRCGPRSTRPAHRAIPRARARRQAPVIPAASSR